MSDFISQEEFQKIKAYLPEDIALISSLAVSTGLRISDILALTPQKLVKRPYIKSSKTGKVQRYFIGEKALKALRSNSNAFWVFPSPYRGGKAPRSRSGVFRAIRSASKRAGLSSLHISPHSFRKLYAVNLLRRTRDIEQVKARLQHDNLDTTMIYCFSDQLRKLSP